MNANRRRNRAGKRTRRKDGRKHVYQTVNVKQVRTSKTRVTQGAKKIGILERGGYKDIDAVDVTVVAGMARENGRGSIEIKTQ